MALRVLAISDEVVNRLYTTEITRLVGPVDLLLGCGDLPYTYMEYVVTELQAAHALYVHGNHDSPEYLAGGREVRAPGGWQNVDRRSVYVKRHDVIVAGLEGSIRYKPHAPYQYVDAEMMLRAQKLVLRFMFNRVRYGRYVDIFLAHSPPLNIHDDAGGAHQGFRVFRTLIRRFRPRLFLHGHKHRYGPGSWHTRHVDTEVVNVHPFRLIALEGRRVTYGKLHRRSA